MAKLTVYATGPLTATADPRVKRGLLLPYGQPGHTSQGKVIASRGSLQLADKPDPLTLEHVPALPAADWVGFEETDEGLVCSVRYHDTPMGNAALAEAESGERTGLSVELDSTVIRGGRLFAGTLTGGSQVKVPAFDSARLIAAELPDVPDTPLDEIPPELRAAVELLEAAGWTVEPPEDPTDAGAATSDPATTTTTASKPTNEGNTEMTVTVQAPELVASATTSPAAALTRTRFLGAIASNAHKGMQQLTAALADIIPADILGMDQGQYVKQLWDGKAYQRRIVPLYNHADLTSYKVKGWRWVTRPEVDVYAGNKTPIPSNQVETEPVDIDAFRLAGGHNIDRKFRDFDDVEFWDAYYRAMTESTARKSDVAVRAAVAANATQLHLDSGDAPADVPTALWLIVEGIVKMLDTLEVIPDHALVESDLWKPLMFTKATDVLVYLDAMLGFDEGTLSGGKFRIIPVPVGSLTVDVTPDPDFAGKVLVGSRDAVTVHELGGEAPIRVEAPNIPLGGIDTGVFSYAAVNVHSADGLVLIDTPTPA